MRRKHPRRAAVGVTVAALFIATAAPAAMAQWARGPCSEVPGGDGQGATGGTYTEICQGSGAVFVDRAVGQVVAVRGPTVVGPVAAVGAVNTSAGAVAGNSGTAVLAL